MEQPFGIYIHWPYCASKCPYCDFNSQVRQPVNEDRYLAAALKELSFYAELTIGRTVSSIFFGGGTPSLMQPETTARLLRAVSAHWAIASDVEISMEANPSSVDTGRFAEYRAAGVNRLSLGVQALADEALRFLGRTHTVAEARTAVDIAKAHFDRISFDMIYARPGQNITEWRAELTEALTLAPGHLSLYQLTLEPGTALFRQEQAGKFTLPNSEDAAALYTLTNEVCAEAGFAAYEVSNYARPGQEAQHNLLYWRYGEYVGIGPGAHGRIVTACLRQAFAAESDPERWASLVEHTGNGLATREALTRLEEAQEMLLMGMRLTEGVPLYSLAERTGYTIESNAIQRLVDYGFLKPENADALATTSDGRLVLNAVIEALVEGLTSC
jgi:putative oxygen-independent coproporphyrinogen III oxidase